MKPQTFLRAPIGIAALLLAAAAIAGPGADRARVGDQAMSEQQFLNDAARGSLAEVTLGQMAETKAGDPEVQEFAARMIADHSKALAEAKQLANDAGVEVSLQMSQKHEQLAESLSAKPKGQFDQAYMQAMVDEHKSTIQKFEQQTQHGDGRGAVFAEEQLPALREHLTMAEAISEKLTNGGG